MNILVTGGLGYIGSHTCVELLKNGYEVIVLDNLYNSTEDVKEKIEKISGKRIKFYKGDMCEKTDVERVFEENKIDALIHFAGYKAVGESVLNPLKYYKNNVGGTVVLCEACKKYGCKKFIFSSSATVYKISEIMPLKEDFPLGTANPYGSTKLMIENILQDVYKSDDEWSIALLRYFNPIGAHESGLIGEKPKGIPNNLMPYITQVAAGKLPYLNVFGNDYNTYDGTGVRDYIHVVDLAKGHIKALEKLEEENKVYIYNLGTGVGYSVLDVVNAFERSTGIKIDYKFKPRRPGDIDLYYADATKAFKEMGWKAELDIDNMCQTS